MAAKNIRAAVDKIERQFPDSQFPPAKRGKKSVRPFQKKKKVRK